MARSFRKIDYRLRPAKGVERRIIAEAFLRLRAFGAVESYRYVGMGSVYFSDFALFHSVCGFETMVSIEDSSDPKVQDRFRFNAPLGSIDLNFGHSNTVLPTLPWDLRSVVWMDYDGHLDSYVLTDVSYLASKLCSGSVLAVTVNANLEDEERGEKRHLQILTDRLGSKTKLPDWVTTVGSFRPAETARLFHDILTQEIRDGINDRNSGRPQGQKYVFEQILFFRYRDGDPMLTLCWVFFDEGQRQTFESCGFSKLPHFRKGDDPFLIDVPLITSAEIREINRCRADGNDPKLEGLPIPPAEIAKYQNLRRYWPIYALPEIT